VLNENLLKGKQLSYEDTLEIYNVMLNIIAPPPPQI
jgi:hypothetical protein